MNGTQHRKNWYKSVWRCTNGYCVSKLATHLSTDRNLSRPAQNDLKVKGGEHSRRGGLLSRRHKNLFLNNFLINNHRFSELNRGVYVPHIYVQASHILQHNGGRGIAEIGNVIILIINIYLENQN